MTRMTDTAATAAIGAANRELRLPVIRNDAERLAAWRAYLVHAFWGFAAGPSVAGPWPG